MAFRWNTRILFIDTDASTRIHYTAMFRYFEVAELEMFREAGVLHKHAGVAFPRVHVECDYSGAMFFDDPISIDVSVAKLGGSSIHLAFRVLKKENEVAKGRVVIACLDRASQRAVPIPDSVRERLTPYVTG